MSPIQSSFGSEFQFISSNQKILFVALFFVVFVCILSLTVIVCACTGKKKNDVPETPSYHTENVGLDEKDVWPQEVPDSLKSATSPSPSLSQKSVNLSTVKEGTESQRTDEEKFLRVVQLNQSQGYPSLGLNTMKSADNCVPIENMVIIDEITKNSADIVTTSEVFRSKSVPAPEETKNENVTNPTPMISVDTSSDISFPAAIRNSKLNKNVFSSNA